MDETERLHHFYSGILEPTSDIDELVATLHDDIGGGVLVDGIDLAEEVLIVGGNYGRPLFFEAERIQATEVDTSAKPGEYTFAASPTPFNQGFVLGFEMATSDNLLPGAVHQINTYEDVIEMGASGLVGEPSLVRSYDEIDVDHVAQMTRTAGFVVLPKLPVISLSIHSQ